MKIAVTVADPDLKSQVDSRFGRAPFFLIVDSDTMEWEAVENSQNLNLSQGAGIQAAQTVSAKAPKVLLTGNCGPKAFKVLRAAGIDVCVGVSGITAEKAVRNYLEGEFTPADDANVEGHWV